MVEQFGATPDYIPLPRPYIHIYCFVLFFTDQLTLFWIATATATTTNRYHFDSLATPTPTATTTTTTTTTATTTTCMWGIVVVNHGSSSLNSFFLLYNLGYLFSLWEPCLHIIYIYKFTLGSWTDWLLFFFYSSCCVGCVGLDYGRSLESSFPRISYRIRSSTEIVRKKEERKRKQGKKGQERYFLLYIYIFYLTILRYVTTRSHRRSW